MDVFRQNTPPPPGPEFEVKRLRANEEMTILVCSPCVWGFWTHWLGKKSSPCFKDKAKCPGHRMGAPLRWKGYLFVIDQELKKVCYLEVTPHAVRSLLDGLPQESSLRGWHLRVRRMAGDRARLRVSMISQRNFAGECPPDRDPYPTLAKLWGLSGPADGPLDRNDPCFDG